MGHFLSLISTFLAGFAVGFARVWPIAVVGVVAIPLILFPGLLYSSILHSLSSKDTQSYSTAGETHTLYLSPFLTRYITRSLRPFLPPPVRPSVHPSVRPSLMSRHHTTGIRCTQLYTC